jgi:hypothetical protein
LVVWGLLLWNYRLSIGFAGLTVGFGIIRFIYLHEVECECALSAHCRRPRRRCWGSSDSHRPALAAKNQRAKRWRLTE